MEARPKVSKDLQAGQIDQAHEANELLDKRFDELSKKMREKR